MQVIINSVHSQVAESLASMGNHPRLIVSMDSHLDVSLGGDDLLYPKELRVIARRTGAHAAFRRLGGANRTLWRGTPGNPEPRLLVVIPELMLLAHARDIEAQLPPSLRLPDGPGSIASCLDYLEGAMGIEVYQSPPNRLLKLVPMTKRAGPWILDIDVDYIHEMQSECYTRIVRPEQGVLQTRKNVLAFIREAKPRTITLSEARVAAIRNPKSVFSSLVVDLEEMGYHIRERGVFKDDTEVTNGISVCREFYWKVSRVLVTKSMRSKEGEIQDFREEEKAASRKFFSSRGYTSW